MGIKISGNREKRREGYFWFYKKYASLESIIFLKVDAHKCLNSAKAEFSIKRQRIHSTYKKLAMNKIIWIIIALFAIGGIVFVQLSTNKHVSKRNLLKNEGEFSIGIFKSRNYSKGKTYSISFNYTIENKLHKNGDTRCFLDSPKAADAFTNKNLARTNDKFLVLYEKENPQNSIIRLDYPIKDSSDFFRYIKEFDKIRSQRTE